MCLARPQVRGCCRVRPCRWRTNEAKRLATCVTKADRVQIAGGGEDHVAGRKPRGVEVEDGLLIEGAAQASNTTVEARQRWRLRIVRQKSVTERATTDESGRAEVVGRSAFSSMCLRDCAHRWEGP